MERACEVAWTTATARYWFPQVTEQQLEWQRRSADGDVRRLLDTAAELGVLTVADGAVSARGSPSPWCPRGSASARRRHAR